MPRKCPIHLVMDNAGGHGTDEAKDDFEYRLKVVYNVKIVGIISSISLKSLDDNDEM